MSIENLVVELKCLYATESCPRSKIVGYTICLNFNHSVSLITRKAGQPFIFVGSLSIYLESWDRYS